jgi:sugar lactone lactonase YvrE
MKLNKSGPLILSALLLTSCLSNLQTTGTRNNPVNQVFVPSIKLTREDIDKLNKEYLAFSTKDLTISYILRKLISLIGNDNGVANSSKIVKELEFYMFKTETTIPFRAMLAENPELYSILTGIPGVQTLRTASPPFDQFITNSNPVPPPLNVTTYAGRILQSAPGIGVAADSSETVYVSDRFANRILKITPSGDVTTFVGGTQGTADGNGTDAQFNYPYALAIDSAGNLYVGDTHNNTIRKITPNGNVTTLAGGGADGQTAGYLDDNGTAALFNSPFGIAVDSAGNVYASDTYNHRIRKITPNGDVSTLAGGSINGYAEGSGTFAKFYYPEGLAADSAGNVYVADTGNHRIRKVTPDGDVTTFAGSDAGSADGNRTEALFNQPTGVTIDSAGNFYICDYINSKIRKITPNDDVTTLAGGGADGQTAGYLDGNGTAALFYNPEGLTVDASGNVYVADYNNNSIRKIAPNGSVSTIAGDTSQGYSDGNRTVALFNSPNAVAVDSSGDIFIADTSNNIIRKINATGVVTTLAGTPGVSGLSDGNGTAAQFNSPNAVAVDSAGNIYVADTFNNIIRKITPNGDVSTLGGTTAVFSSPSGVAADLAGNIYFTEINRSISKIKKITAAGDVTTLAGGPRGYADGNATSAMFNRPHGLAVDSAGNIYVADTFNHRIRKIKPNGNVSTLAGLTNGYADGNGTSAMFSAPEGVAVDQSGNVFVGDTGNNVIRKIKPNGNVSTLAGSTPGYEDGLGTSTQFNSPNGIAVDSAGSIFVADSGNSKIRKIQ